MSARVRIAAAIASLLITAAAHAQESVRLRAKAEVAGEGSVRLADIAQIEGPKAAELGELVVFESWSAAGGKSGATRLSIEELRGRLDALGVNWGRTTLRGTACAITHAKPEEPAHEPAPPAPSAAAAPTGPTVRSQIIARIGQILGLEQEELRLRFDASDDKTLNTSVEGRTLELSSGGLSDRVAVTVRLYEGERLVVRESVRVGVEVKKTVLLAALPLRRGDEITPRSFTAQEDWVGPAQDIAGEQEAVGSIVRSRVEAGERIGRGDLERAVAVRKGDLVRVACISGSVILSMPSARATQEGRVGDVITFEAGDPNRKSRNERKQTFQARVDGPGRAVTVVPSASPEPRPMPTPAPEPPSTTPAGLAAMGAARIDF